MAEYRQGSRRATIQTPLGDETLKLVRLQGTEAISQPFEYLVELISSDSSIEGSQLVGKPVSISFAGTGGYTRNIHGMVSSFCYRGQCADAVSATGYQVKVVPWFWFLKNNKDCEIFQEMKVPQIIEKVFRDLGFNDFTMQLSEQYAEREYCVQYNESDFDFVSRLMEEEGIFYFFKHSAGKHVMVLADSLSAYYDLRDSQVDVTPKGQPQKSHVFGWQHSYEFRPGKVARRDFNFKKPTDKLEAKEESRTPYTSKERFEVYEYPGRYYEGQVGSRLAKVRREQVDADHEVIRGEGYYPSFSPGGKFTVSKHQRSADQGKSFVLTSVKTEFTSGFDFDTPSEVDFINEFTCIPAETVFRPARKTPKPLADGPQTAIVATDGDEIFVDEHARVKVQFHWDRYGKKDSKSSCWIRVAKTHAGMSWGMIDIPRKDEEVIVSFLDGDPDRPIITGRVYNGDSRSPFGLKGPEDNAKHKTRSGFRTKTYKGDGYNELVFDDRTDDECVYLHAQKNLEAQVLNNSTSRIGGNQHEIVGSEKDGKKVGDAVRLVYGNQHMTVKGHQSEHVEGNVELLVGEGSANSGGNLDIVVDKQKSESVGGESHLVIKGAHSEKVDGDFSSTVGGDHQLKVAKNIAAQAGPMGEIHLKAGMKVIVEAGMQISLVGPGGFIDIGPAGVTIQGILVKINSGGSKGNGKGCKPKEPKAAKKAKPKSPNVAKKSK